MHSWLNFNGSFIREGSPVVTANNRGLRYGDGIFETMKLVNGEIRLQSYHFERMWVGAEILQLSFPNGMGPGDLEHEIIRTAEKNRVSGAARVRVMLFRGDGGLYEIPGEGGGLIIQVWGLPSDHEVFHEAGLLVNIFGEVYKSCDQLSNLKTNNYLVYVLAALHAKKHNCNDSLILNSHGRICDASIANIFWVKGEEIYTPPLSEGCVAGVMRRHLLQMHPSIREKICTVAELEQADEIFLTNAVAGIRWVSCLNEKHYENKVSRALHASIF